MSEIARYNLTAPFGRETLPTLEDAAYNLYRDLFEQLQKDGLHPLRVWNRVAVINQGSDELGNGPEERYKLFNRGRRRAWLEYDPTLETVCAASCVDSRGQDEITVSCLATPHPVIKLENPNQISFLDYSAKYGTPPCSRRGSLHLTPNGPEIWISGTASIVGEDNRFAGDHEPKGVAKQVRRTLQNIEALISDKNLKVHCPDWKTRNLSLPDLREVTVFVRNQGDEKTIRNEMESAGINTEEVIYTPADICRRPLDVEIEGMISISALL